MLIKKSLLAIFLCGIFNSSFAQSFINNEQLTADYAKSADSLRAVTTTISAIEVTSALQNNTQAVDINLLKATKKVLSASQVYNKAQKSTVIIGSAYLCPRCSHTHVGISTGYIIDPDGIVVTNYHVATAFADMSQGNKPLAFMARMANGRTFAVVEVLAASERDDLAILRINTNGATLPSLALSEGAKIGDKAYALGHSHNMYYYFTEGIVNHKQHQSTEDSGKKYSRDIMNISAEYGVGASGGPILDAYGNVIGTVSSTRTMTYSQDRPMVQMVLKNTIPVESLRKLVR